MTDFVHHLTQGWTPGAVGAWGTWIAILMLWWKGLPALIDAMSNRQSKIEERMSDLLDKATIRFEREIAAADQRHDECMAGQQLLIKRIETLEAEKAEDRDQIEGLRRKVLQLQTSAIRIEGQPITGFAREAIETLGRIGATIEDDAA